MESEIKSILNIIWKADTKAWGAGKRLSTKYPEISLYLDQKYNGITTNKSQQAWMFINDVSNVPQCYCGNYCEFLGFSRGFRTYCSIKCMSNSPAVRNKTAITTTARHGGAFFSTDRFKTTMVEKYGVTNPGQIESNKITRSKKKSNTYICQKIQEVKEQYVPLFDINLFSGVHEPSKWKCLSCGTEFEQKNMAYQELNCVLCFPTKNFGKSKLEVDFLDWISTLTAMAVYSKNRSQLKKRELDIWLPDLKLAIEICGSYWHNDQHLEKNYHQEKLFMCNERGIKLLTLFDFDLKKKHIIEGLIKNNLHLEPVRIPARKCQISPITSSQAVEFNNVHHLRGHAPASHHYGMFFQDELVAVSSWSKPRYTKTAQLELIRLCSRSPIQGLLGKMTHHVSRDLGINTIISYVDLRYGDGRSYLASGYSYVTTTKPGYWYVDGNLQCFHRSSFMKKNLAKYPNYHESKTEFDIMDELGYNRICDCGNKLFQWEANN